MWYIQQALVLEEPQLRIIDGGLISQGGCSAEVCMKSKI